METLTETVQAGIDALNADCPDWLEKIRLEDLDLGDAYGCVLAQVYGSYLTGREALDLVDGEQAADLGFDNWHYGYAELQAEWEYRINEMRDNG